MSPSAAHLQTEAGSAVFLLIFEVVVRPNMMDAMPQPQPQSTMGKGVIDPESGKKVPEGEDLAKRDAA